VTPAENTLRFEHAMSVEVRSFFHLKLYLNVMANK